VGFTPLHAALSPDLSKLTVPVQTQDLTIRVEASGSVVPLSTVNISPKTSGQLAALRRSRRPSQQIVARMDSETLKAELARAKAQAGGLRKSAPAAAARNNIARAKVAAAQAQADLNRAGRGGIVVWLRRGHCSRPT